MNAFRSFLALTLAAALGLTACAAIETQDQPRAISVSGIGYARVAPDQVIITLGVQTQDASIGQAVRENNRRAETMKQAILAAGVAPEDLQTTFFNVFQQQRFDEFGNPTGELVYVVDNTVTVRLRDIDKLSGLLEAALEDGATSVNGVTFGVEDPTEALSQARQEAVEAARAHADELAAASGASLGRILSINEDGFFPGPVFEAPAFERAGGGGVPISPGTLEFQVQVFIVYEIQ